MPIRIVLADDHPIVLQGLQHLFARHPDMEVVASCAGADEALAAARHNQPEVVVLDLRMPQRSGLDLLAVLGRELPHVRSVVLTAAITQDQVMEALKRGAAGIVLKESPPEQLLECVRRVAQGLRNRVIGERLVISESTVKVHLHNIYEKLGIEGRLELVLLAQQKGLV